MKPDHLLPDPYRVLCVVKESFRLNYHEIADKAGLEDRATAMILNACETEGLVTKHGCDAFCWWVLTDQGIEDLKEGSQNRDGKVLAPPRFK